MEVNINREVEDTFYRYKMPKLTAKVEGKGNGIKTVIVNVTDIAKALYRKPTYVTKYFGCELGAQVYVDEKNDRYIVNGAHEAAKLQEILDGFIKKFVLCQECHNPETSLRVKKKAGIVNTLCKACGAQGMLDVGHRLTQYIIKNPPDEDNTTSGKKGKKNKKNGGDQESGDEEAVNGDEHRHSPSYAEDRNDDWGEDTTEEAQLERMNELSSMAKSLALSVDVEKTESERADIFFKHVTKLFNEGKIETKTREVHQEADRLCLGPRIVMVVAEVLLSNPQTIITDINKYRFIFMSFTRNGEHGARAQQYLLGAMTKLIEKYSDENLLARTCHILKEFYDSDIIEEESIIAWYDKGPSKKFVAKDFSAKILEKCMPMVKWLKEAEEEDSDDDEENENGEEESEDEPSPTAKSATKPISASKIAKDDDDDIDIDAI